MTQTIVAAAITWWQAGCTPIPTRTDGTKAPAVDWKPFQNTQPDLPTILAMFTADTDGLGIITGPASGNLLMVELEGRAVDEGCLTDLEQIFTDHDQHDLWHTLHGYTETTPSGGIHWYLRVADTDLPGNQKLARRPATPAELEHNPKEKLKVLAETRGRGGFSVVAPSAGRTHPTGQAWTTTHGTPATIPTVTRDQLDAILMLVGMLDQTPEHAQQPTLPTHDTPARPRQPGDPVRPGDDYNQRAEWADILMPHGWTVGHKIGGAVGWRRPGKTDPGISATTGRNGTGPEDRLYVFSSSTEFEQEVPYSKFGAFCLLEHNGDFAAATRALSASGYGDQTKPGTDGNNDDVYALVQRPQLTVITGGLTDGANALAPHAAAAPQNTMLRSEDGHANQLINSHGHLIRYCPDRSLWLAWDGTRWAWQPSGGGTVREHAKAVARSFPDTDQAEKNHKRRALSAQGTSGCLRQAETDDRIVVAITDLDAHPYELNTPAGIVDLRTGNLRPPDPAALHTRTTTAAPDFDNTSALWDRFLATTFNNDTDLIAYVQRLFGISLIGTVREQILVFPHGVGANGKSTFTDVCMTTVGTGEHGYARALPSEALMIRKHSEHPAELAQLSGARMVVCSELDEGQRFAEARVKQLTGGDQINARFMRGNPFTFVPTHTLWLVGNHHPTASTGGESFWRRIRRIPFDHVVPANQRDPALTQKLTDHAGIILAWGIRGAVDYLTHGIQTPQVVIDASKAYEIDQDTVGRFVTDEVNITSTLRAPVTAVRAAYEQWCRETGDTPVSARRLTQELRDKHGITVSRSNGKRFYEGIVLNTPAEEEDPWWNR